MTAPKGRSPVDVSVTNRGIEPDVVLRPNTDHI